MMIICLQDQLFYKTRNKMYDCKYMQGEVPYLHPN